MRRNIKNRQTRRREVFWGSQSAAHPSPPKSFPSSRLPVFSLVIALACAACGSDPPDPPDIVEKPPQCGTSKYVAFADANHLTQDQQLIAHSTILAKLNAASSTPTSAPSNFAMAESAYNTAELRAGVQAIGGTIDQTIIDGLTQGKTATTAPQADLAAALVSNAMIRFFFTAMTRGTKAGTPADWDRAQVYFGAGKDLTANLELGVAGLSTEGDLENGTNLTAQIFNAFLDGSCRLATELEAKNATMVRYQDVAALKTVVDKLELDLQKVIAYAIAVHALAIEELQPNEQRQSEIEIEYVAAEQLFQAIEPLMSAERAAAIRAIFDVRLRDPNWAETIDAGELVEELEAEYRIDIGG